MLTLGVIAALAMILGAVGLYGVLAYVVAERTREIGVRMALGAQRRDVLKLIVGQGIVLAVIGIVVGLALAFTVTRLLASQLYGLSATDPVTFIGVSIFLLSVSFIACYLPARRATRIDPLAALRHE
jgi:ABC-type antimicrobial peptide transport system permease subunit